MVLSPETILKREEWENTILGRFFENYSSKLTLEAIDYNKRTVKKLRSNIVQIHNKLNPARQLQDPDRARFCCFL